MEVARLAGVALTKCCGVPKVHLRGRLRERERVLLTRYFQTARSESQVYRVVSAIVLRVK